MRDRFLRALLLVLLALVLVVLARPYIDQALFAAKEPRAIEARGDLAQIERLNIEIFQRASPSVVQIASRAGGATATTSAPTLPPAPDRFSITTGWPHLRESQSPTMRGNASALPPAG